MLSSEDSTAKKTSPNVLSTEDHTSVCICKIIIPNMQSTEYGIRIRSLCLMLYTEDNIHIENFV